MVETPAYDLTIFKLHFGKLTLKAYTKGECVLRFEAIVHNTKELRCGRLLERTGSCDLANKVFAAKPICTSLGCIRPTGFSMTINC